ncbi:MAG: peroxiredoxin [Usitatibacter sp.]
MLHVGQPAPSFQLPDASMEMMDLSSYRGKKNVVLYFYPKDGTPGCTIQAIGFSDRENEFEKLDTIVFGVSRDDVLSHQAFRDEHGLTVNLLADTEQEVSRLYDVIQDKIVDGLPRRCLLRSTFVIDKKGVVRHILQDVNPKAHVSEVLKVCKTLVAHAN